MADGKKAKKSSSRPKGDAKPKGEKRKKAKASVDSGVEALTRLVDHPLVTDLLAVGAMAAVAAIAEHGVQSKSGAKADGSRKAVKAAGKAAAAAIGARLLKEVSGFGAKAAAAKK